MCNDCKGLIWLPTRLFSRQHHRPSLATFACNHSKLFAYRSIDKRSLKKVKSYSVWTISLRAMLARKLRVERKVNGISGSNLDPTGQEKYTRKIVESAQLHIELNIHTNTSQGITWSKFHASSCSTSNSTICLAWKRIYRWKKTKFLFYRFFPVILLSFEDNRRTDHPQKSKSTSAMS
jgi:hypothetical protein